MAQLTYTSILSVAVTDPGFLGGGWEVVPTLGGGKANLSLTLIFCQKPT